MAKFTVEEKLLPSTISVRRGQFEIAAHQSQKKKFGRTLTVK